MVRVRGALALGLLGAYWAGRRLVLVGLLGAAGGAWATGTVWPATLLTAVAVLAVVLSVRVDRTVRRCTHRDPVGVPVPPRSDSPLWREVRALCGELQVRPLEEIRIGPEPVIEVWERPHRLGLAAGPRYLYVGLPLLVGLPAAQVRALLVHELAHDSREAGRFPAVCHRTRATVGSALAQRPRTTAVVFAAAARLFLAVESAVGRDQEFRADRAAVRLAGRSSMAGALRELPVVAAAWRRYLTEVIAPGLRYGYAPLSLGDGFHHTRRRWGAEPTPAPPESPSVPWDVHPSRLDRLHAIDLAPGPAAVAELAQWRPAQTTQVQQVERDLVGTEVRRVPWEEFEAVAEGEKLRGEVARFYLAAGEAAGEAVGEAAGDSAGSIEADLDTVLTLLEARALTELVVRLRPATTGTARRLLAAALALAAVDAGVARWRRSFSGALQVVRADGGAVPVEELAARVIADPTTVPIVREALRAVQVAHVRALS